MGSKRRFLEGLWKTAVSPKIDDEELQRRLKEARESLPIPVFWLLGKAQSGKTSLVRALTGSSRAEIGSGFRPCTRSAQLYSFPSEEECFVRFLDTRGLGDVDYDPTEEMRQLESQANLLVVVIRAMDHAQQSVLVPCKAILKAHPRWPVIVLQTALHEGYPTPESRHPLPYPFSQAPYPASVPHDLARSLAVQREWFTTGEKGTGPICAKHPSGRSGKLDLSPFPRIRFVPVDFTLPEDGYEPQFYGLDAVWSAIEDALPMGLWAMLRESREARRALRDEHFRTARPHVVFYALAAGGAGAVPLPMVDIPLVLAIQTKLFHTLASIYQQPMNAQRAAEISSALGLGFLGRHGVRQLVKLVPVPGLGSGVGALYAAASTFALGSALCEYFSRVLDGDVPDRKALRQLYAEEFRKGKRWLSVQLKRRVGY